MEIVRKSCAQGAKEVSGLTVIIEVFRAFSCEPLFFYFRATKVVLEPDPERAMSLKKRHPELILVGEVNEVPLENADLGNSPSEIILKGEASFKGKAVVHRTTAGVTGAATVLEKAEEVILGSFMPAKAIAAYLLRRKLDLVTLLVMGERAQKKAPEDEACADYIEPLLSGKPFDPVRSLRDLVFQPTAQKFIKGGKKYLPPEDPIFCLQRDLFDFVFTAKRKENELVVIKAS
jgi:2-phosphosulfolactate phosphatase